MAGEGVGGEDWSHLPNQLLLLIRKYLSFTDCIRFDAVCKSWYSAAATEKPYSLVSPQIPWLLVHGDNHIEDGDDYNSETCTFFSLTYYKFNKMVLPHKELLRSSTLCVGSSYGWLVIVNDNCSIHLLNPFSCAPPIQLPSAEMLPDYLGSGTIIEYIVNINDIEITLWDPEKFRIFCIRKAVLSADPSSTHDYAVMAIHGISARLVLYRAGTESWVLLKEEEERFYHDIIYYKGQFYAVTCIGELVVCDVDDPCPTVIEITSPLDVVNIPSRRYLVESLAGDLLQIVRIQDDELSRVGLDSYHFTCSTVSFRVFKLDEIWKTWVEIFTLGDCLLFIGNNSSISIKADGFPECKANSIYYTDDDWHSLYCEKPPYHDTGFYDFGERRLRRFYPSPLQIFPPPIWIIPNPW